MSANIISAVLSFVFFIFPSVNPTPKADGVLLNAVLISDTHLDSTLPLGQLLLGRAAKDAANPDAAVDAVVVSGDITNYGDKKSITAFYEILTASCKKQALVVASGNHDIDHAEATGEQTRQACIDAYNKYTGAQTDKIYYSCKVNGYTFIVLGDQSEGNFVGPEYYGDQLEFLDDKLTLAQSEGKPAFVVCHVPIAGTNGQQTVWANGCADEEFDLALRAVLERHTGVFFISGHLHAGLNSEFTHTLFDVRSVETFRGVTYINLPTYTLVNRYGIPGCGTGMRMEVYADRIEFRARNFLLGKWYEAYSYTVPLN